jgi:DNA-binding NarL/FixJ family response regulator
MPSQLAQTTSLTLTRAISTDGHTITERPERALPYPKVGLVAAYRCQRLRLSMRFGTIPAFRMIPMSAQDAVMPRQVASNVLAPDCDLLVVEPGDLAHETLSELVQVARRHDLPLIWLGEPPVVHRLASAAIPGGIIPSQASTTQVERTLQAAIAGLTVIHPDYAHVVDQTEPDPDPMPHIADSGPSTFITEPVLSPREHEVMSHVAAGLPNKAIARMLGITDHTVKFHVSSVLTKLNAASRTEAVAIATRGGLLDS